MLISYSKDGIIKLWSFASSTFPGKTAQETICDHESQIRCADTCEWLLGAFDADGKVTVRDLRHPQDCVCTLQIANITRSQHFCFCDSTTFAIGNSSAVELYNVDGQFINMIDLEDKIVYMGIQGSFLVACIFLCSMLIVLETARVVTIDWQNSARVAEAKFESVLSGQHITCGYLSKCKERLMFGTKTGSIITIC